MFAGNYAVISLNRILSLVAAMKSLKAAWLPFELNTNAALLVILSTVTSSQVRLSSSVRCFVSVHWPSWYYRLLSGCDSTFLDWRICFKTNNKENKQKSKQRKTLQALWVWFQTAYSWCFLISTAGDVLAAFFPVVCHSCMTCFKPYLLWYLQKLWAGLLSVLW